MLLSEPGAERAVWDPAMQRFQLRTSGIGSSEFDLGGDPVSAVTEESRSGTADLATRNNWVWDYADDAGGRKGPDRILTKEVANIAPPTPPASSKLKVPDFSRPGAIYNLAAFNPVLDISLVDRNASGMARVYYSVNNGPWTEYTGTPLQIPPQLTTTVKAYAAAVDAELHEDSDERTENYETIYFSGTSSGVFHSPEGDSRLQTNLGSGVRLQTFKWGDPATPDKKQNELQFSGARFDRIGPDTEFVLGTLTYYNGTTHSGTNATSVKVAIQLDLTTPGVKESLEFTFRLLSTPNKGVDADADADFVHIPDVSSDFRTVIKGRTFALVLSFGEHGPNGFTTIDTFHAHEGKALRGTIYGRLVQVR
jgi:hypothetical protein